MKFPPEKNATFTGFHGAKQTGPANTPFYRLHVIDKNNYATWITVVCNWLVLSQKLVEGKC